jgi:uncharacterized protein YcfL
MKSAFIKLGLAAVVLSVIIAGCSSSSEHPPVQQVSTDTGNRFNGITANSIKIITDSETNCKYIYVEDGEGNYKTTAMSPLYKDNVDVDCGQK